MLKRKSDWNEKKFKLYIKEGRGKGKGEDYIIKQEKSYQSADEPDI